MKLRLHIATILMAATVTSCDSRTKTEIGFTNIIVNETKPEQVIALMGGEPVRRYQADLLGAVDVQVMEYDDEKNTYVLAVGGSSLAGVEPRVLAKAMHPRKVMKK
jgi:hypothetical protein